MIPTVRGLLAKVALYRPDVPQVIGEFAIQETVRNICRFTPIAIETQVPVAVLSGNMISTVTPSNGNILSRVEAVTYAAFPSTLTTSSQGSWNAATNTPALTTSAGANGQFYIVSVGGTQSITGASTVFGAGDVIYATGSAWVRIALADFAVSRQTNLPGVNPTGSVVPAAPSSWNQQGNTVRWLYPIAGDQAIAYQLSFIPYGEFDTIPLPAVAEDAIVYGAIAFLCALPGEGKSEGIAASNEQKYAFEKARLRAIGIVNYSGTSWAQQGDYTVQSSRAANWYE